MLIFTLKNERQSKQIRHEDGALEFGRGPAQNNVQRVVVEDRYTSRDQCRIEELPSGDVRVTNLGSPITLADGSQIASEQARTLVPPAQLNFGYTTLHVGVIPRDSDSHGSSLQTISRPMSRAADGATLQSQLRSVSEAAASPAAPTAEVLTDWFETLLNVQKAAAGSNAFYRETAQAVVQLVGLDRGLVLLHSGGEWKIAGRYSADAKDSGRYSRYVIEEVVRKRSTFYQSFAGGGESESLQSVDAVVASPIVDDAEQVVGVVYGSRDLRAMVTTGSRGIQQLEAQLVQVLAGAVSAGLARVSREAEAARTRVQFEQFVSAELAQALERDAGILAANERELTLLFTDLRGFTGISERIGAAATYDLLSDILDRLTNHVMDHGGVVIDYYGDGLAAMWNAPFDQQDHAVRAARAAQAMLNELPAINALWAERLGASIKIGIGINSGRSQVGNSGSKRRMKYGPRGHAVNLASRVEAATKILGVPCLLTESTLRHLPPELPARRICQVQLSGMTSAVDLFELPPEHPSEQWLKQRELYENAVMLYEQDRASECLDIVTQLVGQFGTSDIPTIRLQLRAQQRLSQPSGILSPAMIVDTKSA